MLWTVDSWDLALGVLAGYFAVVMLVRLMRQRRGALAARFCLQAAAWRRRHGGPSAQRPAQPDNSAEPDDIPTSSHRHKPAA